jgi:hypothetical protein
VLCYIFSEFVGSYCRLAASKGYHRSADAITPLRAFARVVGSSSFISWKNLDMIFVFLQASHLDQGRAGGSETSFFMVFPCRMVTMILTFCHYSPVMVSLEAGTST